MKADTRARRLAVLLGFSLLLGACGSPAPGGDQTHPLTLVKVAQPRQADTTIYRDFPGQVTPVDIVDVRSKVTGLVRSQEFKEGQMVAAEQVLYRLDADSLRAQVEQATGRVRDAEAVLNKAETDVARFSPLVETGAISRKEFDDAVSVRERASADVASARALLDQAGIALRDAVIRSPYEGRIGRSLVNVGSLVVANQTVLAQVSTTDVERFDFAFSERDYLEYFRPFIEKYPEGLEAQEVSVQLFLADGNAYDEPGYAMFADRELSSTTGTFAMSAIFPNPQEVLRPGMYGRARIAVGTLPDALLVPQQAVAEILDKHFLTLVNADNQIERRAVVMGLRVGSEWVVEEGLAADDRVVIEGHHKVAPGMTVDIEPWQPAASASG